MRDPDATIVIPCYNHGRFIADAVRSCLTQEQADVRVVVVDDGSDDGQTPAACDACRDLNPDNIIIIHQENRGLPAARNRGAREAAGVFIAFLDADDWIEPPFIRQLRSALGPAPDDVSHAYCQERLVDKGHGLWRVPEWDPLLLMITNLHPVTALIRRDRFEAVGGFDETLIHGYEDWDLWLKMADRGWRGVRVPEPLFVWRRHSNDTMVMRATERFEDLFRSLIDRHRALYEPRMEELFVRLSVLMRQFRMHWIDETGLPRHLQVLLQDQREMRRLRRRVRRTRAEADLVRADYESWAAVRAHHALHRALSRLGPIGVPVRAAARALARLVPGQVHAPKGPR